MSILLVFQLGSFPNSLQITTLENERRFNFGKYVVVTGSNVKGSAISILERGKIIYKNQGGDGIFSAIDTVDINQDKRLDFVFSYAFDDYTNLGILVSKGKRNKYEIISITDEIYKNQDCSFEPYQPDDKRIKDFILTDIDGDGKIDILTNAIVNSNSKIVATECSKVILHPQLLEMLRKR